MNLFDALGLKADPFSTSPNVELFYPAVQHRQCIEGLELAIRMRRGLSVVRGGIGVGKTTISRKLIQNFKAESDDFDFYLILDPKFESELILLQHIIKLFGVSNTGESVQECRNIIENYLLKIGVEQGKILVLIIDEGQNLPGEMLDVFRTLLNFETDDFKLLQLIIFGQPEMGNMIHNYPNFEDRISFDFEIGPLTIEDVKGMIDHRIEISGGKAGSWFTNEAILKIHKNTQGYPRKVTQICHQLLLTMMSENKTEINEEMVKRVISGKIDTGGLLKQKKKNYNEIAVNKLLDVLRKDDPNETPEQIKEQDDSIDVDDDWIGGSNKSEDIGEPLDEIKNPELDVTEQNDDNEIIQSPSVDSEIQQQVQIEPDSTSIDVLPLPGKYPTYISPKKLALDKTIIGIGVDRGRIVSVVIEESKGIKTLVSNNVYSNKNRNLDPSNNSSEFTNACQEAFGNLETNLTKELKAYKSSLKKLKNRDTIAFNMNDDHMLMKMIEVPKENLKEKHKIIEWAIKKELPFPAENLIFNSIKGYNNYFNVGIADNSNLIEKNSILDQLNWGVRWWSPTSQSVFNAFLWNYPEYNQKTILLFHIGEHRSFIIGCRQGTMRTIEHLHIGLQSLTDALRDQGRSTEDWYKRESFQVPEPFLRAMGITVKPGENDGIFQPVFDTWRQEIDRTINGLRRYFDIPEDTHILISGSAGEIQYIEQYIEGILGLKTQILNPIRNIAIAPNESERESISFNPTLLTAAIGSALNLSNSVSVLPEKLKQNEIFRFVNRISIPIAASLLAILLGFTGITRADYNSLKNEIDPLRNETNALSYIEEDHSVLSNNRDNVRDQLEILNYDTEFFNRVLAITRFLSHHTPKEIKLEKLNFQQGWEVKKYQMRGRAKIEVIEMEDEDKRVLLLRGDVKANPALKERYFNNYLMTLEDSGLFQMVEIVFQNTQSNFENTRLQFEIKCII